MTARLVDDDLLQRFHDGDTTDEESTGVRARLAESAEDRRALARLEKLRAMFAEVAKDDVASASGELDALYARVRAKTEAAQALAGGAPAKVVDLGARRRRARTMIPVAALAAAALVLVALLARPFGPGPSGPGGHPTPPGAHPVPEVHASLLGSRVVDEDFGDGAGTVFNVSGEGGATVAVVWVSDDSPTP